MSDNSQTIRHDEVPSSLITKRPTITNTATSVTKSIALCLCMMMACSNAFSPSIVLPQRFSASTSTKKRTIAFLGNRPQQRSFVAASSVSLSSNADDDDLEESPVNGEEEVDEDDDDEYEYEEYEEEEYEGEEYEEEEEEEEEESEPAEDPSWVKEQKELLAFIQDLDQAQKDEEAVNPQEIVDSMTEEELAEPHTMDEFDNEIAEKAATIKLTDDEIESLSELETAQLMNEIAQESESESVESLFPDDEDLPPYLKTADLADYETAVRKLEQIISEDEIENGKTGMIKTLKSIDDRYYMEKVLDPQTCQEIINLDCELDNAENGSNAPEPERLRQQHRQLIYDLDYNVTNLFLSSFKVNPDAPVVLEHWMFQLRNWTRYDYVRERNMNFTWTDVDEADEKELERYWVGTGMDEAPKPSVKDNPNVVDWDESPLSSEEENLLALEQWMDDIYHDEDDINLDDEDFSPDHNVAVPGHEVMDEEAASNDPVLKDVTDFEEKYGHMSSEWREQYVKRHKFEVDTQEDEAFRGHLVIACSPSEDDIEMADKLTVRFEEKFGAKVFVETRVIGHARPEDYVYEIWLESWEVELLHSKRRAVFSRDWDGPRDIDEEYLDRLVNKVDFLISDDYRYSYIMDYTLV